MLTLTSQYALQALIFLAREANGQPTAGPQIARHTGIPAKYLSMVLRALVRAGILNSTRGKGGGFRLAKTAKQVRLLDVISPFEPTMSANAPCPFGNDECCNANPCLAHKQWKKVKQSEERFLRRTSLYDVAVTQRKDTRLKKTKKRAKS